MSKQEIKLQPDTRPNTSGMFFVEYKFNNGEIATYTGNIEDIKKDLNRTLGKGKYIFQGINKDIFKRGQVKTKGKYIILYPNFKGYKKNGYEVDTEMQGHRAWTCHLMTKQWYSQDDAIQDEFDEHWRKLKGSWK
tara:strand:+ start:133 stop:537 length:405 start_codon:yes stop_codon:yes gene_type:complete